MEINPCALTPEGKLVAADAKVIFDDNALYKHPELEQLRSPEEYGADEMDARASGLSYVSLDGTIGCIVNGAGLSMATMDIIKYFGGSPANFLDVGGSSNPEKVLNALRIILKNPGIEAILINIFGGITRCDDIARGILMAREKLGIPVPLVIRLIGTNEKEGRAILKGAGLDAYDDLTEAVKGVVAKAKAAPKKAHPGPGAAAGERQVMSILLGKDSRIIVQGITGRDGSFHALSMKEYGSNVVGGVTPGKGGQDVQGIPVFDTVKDAVEKNGANCTVIFVPARIRHRGAPRGRGLPHPPGGVHHGGRPGAGDGREISRISPRRAAS